MPMWCRVTHNHFGTPGRVSMFLYTLQQRSRGAISSCMSRHESSFVSPYEEACSNIDSCRWLNLRARMLTFVLPTTAWRTTHLRIHQVLHQRRRLSVESVRRLYLQFQRRQKANTTLFGLRRLKMGTPCFSIAVVRYTLWIQLLTLVLVSALTCGPRTKFL